MKNIIVLILLLSQILSVQSKGQSPIPHCFHSQLYQEYPLTIGQIFSQDMSTVFRGYNLSMSLESSGYGQLSKKIQKLDQIQVWIPQIISQYIEADGNSFANSSFILYRDIIGGHHFSYSTQRQPNKLPEIKTTITITSDPTIKCYDGALFSNLGYAIIDCMQYNKSSLLIPYKNIFFYIKLKTHQIIKNQQNDLFINFGNVKQRKLRTYFNIYTQHSYLIRSYISNAVQQFSNNTYIQIFDSTNPIDLQLIALIDRSYLRLQSLNIMDFQVYSNNLFVLDYNTGLYRFIITNDMHLNLVGVYSQNQIVKFSVYSDDLDQELIIALANQQTIYEIDWQDPVSPFLTSKYSLIPQSRIKSLFLNSQYTIIQSSSNATSASQQIQLDYTWIFTKQSRTYSSAYYTINHNSTRVLVLFERSSNNLLLTDEDGLIFYKLNQNVFQIMFADSKFIGSQHVININSISVDHYNHNNLTCSISFKLLIVDSIMNIYSTGINLPKILSSNSQGQLSIFLHDYFIGTNINYKIISSYQLPVNWISKVNKTILHISHKIPIADITMFYTDLHEQEDQQVIIYYYQDTQNKLHIQQCTPNQQTAQMYCKQIIDALQHTSLISSFSTIKIEDQVYGIRYYYMYVLTGYTKEIIIMSYDRNRKIGNITYKGIQDAQIYDIATSNGYLYVLRKYVKIIDVYKLQPCIKFRECGVQFTLDAIRMKKLGVDYFTPRKITTHPQYPQVLFLSSIGSVLIVDIDNKQRITVLHQIQSIATRSDLLYNIAINKDYMILTAYPNIIQQYSLRNIYRNQKLRLLKNIQLYQYTIPPHTPLQFSQNSNLIYIYVQHKTNPLSTILVYYTGVINSNNLYAIISLNKLYYNVNIQVSGLKNDYLNIITETQFFVFRVYNQPKLTLLNISNSFSFTIQLYNNVSNLTTTQINVNISNNPSKFLPTNLFNQTFNNLHITEIKSYIWDDKQWFNGHIINYNYSCPQCINTGKLNIQYQHSQNYHLTTHLTQKSSLNQISTQNNSQSQNAFYINDDSPKIKLREHIDSIYNISFKGVDYTQTLFGGISLWNNSFVHNLNGSIQKVLLLPETNNCVFKKIISYNDVIITACRHISQGISLYLTTTTSFKSFTWGPYKTPAKQIQNIQIVNNVLIICDIPPQLGTRQGNIILYLLDPSNINQPLKLLSVIDSNDLDAYNWNQLSTYLANACLFYSFTSNSFHLYITQVYHGIFIVQFNLHSSIFTLLRVSFIDIKLILLRNQLHMPDDAIFQAIAHNGRVYSAQFQVQQIIVTTKKYHIFQFNIIFDSTMHAINATLNRLYRQYGFYQAYNQIKANDQFMAIGYLLPKAYFHLNYPKHYIALYDTKIYTQIPSSAYQQRYIISACPLSTTYPISYDFNTTYNHESNGSRLGLILQNSYQQQLLELSISKYLHLQAIKGAYDQTIDITVYNDFHQFKFNINVNFAKDDEMVQEIIQIIIIIAIAFICIIFIIYITWCVKKRNYLEKRQSLLTQQNNLQYNQSITYNQADCLQPSNVGVSNQLQQMENNSQENINQNQMEAQKIQNNQHKQQQQTNQIYKSEEIKQEHHTVYQKSTDQKGTKSTDQKGIKEVRQNLQPKILQSAQSTNKTDKKQEQQAKNQQKQSEKYQNKKEAEQKGKIEQKPEMKLSGQERKQGLKEQTNIVEQAKNAKEAQDKKAE